MLGMGIGEFVVVIVVVLIVLGPEKIPETARVLGRWFYEIKRSIDDVKETFEKEAKNIPRALKDLKIESPLNSQPFKSSEPLGPLESTKVVDAVESSEKSL